MQTITQTYSHNHKSLRWQNLQIVLVLLYQSIRIVIKKKKRESAACTRTTKAVQEMLVTVFMSTKTKHSHNGQTWKDFQKSCLKMKKRNQTIGEEHQEV